MSSVYTGPRSAWGSRHDPKARYNMVFDEVSTHGVRNSKLRESSAKLKFMQSRSWLREIDAISKGLDSIPEIIE